MKFKELFNKIKEKLKPEIENHSGLKVFATERAKFEGWLKVELCKLVNQEFEEVFPIKKENSDWQYQLDKIKEEIDLIKCFSFNFDNNVPGAVYFGKVE